MGTKIRPFNLHTTVDSHVKGLIDSAYIQARTAAGTDSSSTQAMIDSNFTSGTITFGNTVTAPRGRFTSGSDVSLSSTGHGLQVGSTGSSNIAIDGNEILARNNGSSNQLDLNTNGGIVRIGDQLAGTKLSVRGPILAEDSATFSGKVKADIRSNPNALSRTHTIDSNSNGLLVGPINVDSGVTLTINGTLMVV